MGSPRRDSEDNGSHYFQDTGLSLGMALRSRDPDQEAILQKYSLDLLTCIDEMKHKRDVLHRQIETDTREKDKLQHDLRTLTDRLVKVNERLCDQLVARARLEQTIGDTQRAFTEMAVGSDNLLSFMKKVTSDILPEITTKEEPEKEVVKGSKRQGNKKIKTN